MLLVLNTSSPVFDATQQERRPVFQSDRTGVEHRVHRIWQVRRGQNRIAVIAAKERLVFLPAVHWTGPVLTA